MATAATTTTRPWETGRPTQPTKQEPSIQSVSAWDLLQESRRLQGTFPLLLQSAWKEQEDGLLSWLRLPPGLHEIAGEAGAGKSQIAMSLSVDIASEQAVKEAASRSPAAELSVEGASAVLVDDQHLLHSHHAPPASNAASSGTISAPVYYVCMRSSSKFVERMQQMVQARNVCPSALERILIREALNVEHLLELLRGLLQTKYSTTASSSLPPRLLVLDSVADLVRGETGPTLTATKGGGAEGGAGGWAIYASLRSVARLARTFSERHGVAVVCVNHVTADMSSTTSSGSSVKPALGLTWAQEMDRSYIVSRTASSTSEPTEAPLRSIELRRSSQYGPHRALFTVQAQGVSIATDGGSS